MSSKTKSRERWRWQRSVLDGCGYFVEKTMSVEFDDQSFIAAHNFDADIPPSNSAAQVACENRLLIDGYIEGHGGTRISMTSLHEATGIDTRICKAILDTHPLVRRIDGRRQDAYLSLAPPLVTLFEEKRDSGQHQLGRKDQLGREAREDMFNLVELRILQMKQRRKDSSFRKHI